MGLAYSLLQWRLLKPMWGWLRKGLRERRRDGAILWGRVFGTLELSVGGSNASI